MTTETKVKHTPLPWRIGGIIPEGAIQLHCDGPPIGLVRFSDARSRAEAEANAALIIRAVNNHAQLVAACKKTIFVLQESISLGDHPLVDELNGLIAKAEHPV